MDAKYFLPVAFAETLRHNRHAKRFSQEKLAKQAGISRAQIGKLENASANPSVETMLKLSIGLGLDLGGFGSQLQANYNNTVKLLSDQYAKSGVDALHRYTSLNNDPLRNS